MVPKPSGPFSSGTASARLTSPARGCRRIREFTNTYLPCWNVLPRHNRTMPSDAAPCIFCNPEREIIVENATALAVYDRYPVSPGHALVLPRRHVVTIWDLDEAEYDGCFRLVREVRSILEMRYGAVGFNVGANCGEAAGQSVWHAHIHVIPRYQGDVADPLGGVRHVIPRKL